MKVPLVDLKQGFKRDQTEIATALESAFANVTFIGGAPLAEFEAGLSAMFASFAKDGDAALPPPVHAIGCSSGTDALVLALMALDIKPSDEIITTPYTFIATAEAIALLGAKPVFVDVDPQTYLMDMDAVASAITARTKAVIPVGLFGVPADMDTLAELSEKHGLAIIEDAAQSLGAIYKGRPSGVLFPQNSSTVRGFGCTSFFPAKPLGGAGDAGAIFTTNENDAALLRELLNHGQDKRYSHKRIGLNARLDTLQAIVLTVKLKHFAAELTARRRVAARYDAALDRSRYVPQMVPEGIVSSYAQYSLTCESASARESLRARLSAAGIGVGMYYPIPLHLQEAFAFLGHTTGDFPVSERLAETMLSIPVHPFLSDEDVETVIAVINRSSDS